MPLLIAALLGFAAPADDLAGAQFAQLTVRQRVVIRVQTLAPVAIPPRAPRPVWREMKGPRCIPMNAIVAAAVLAPSSVDLMLRGGQRLRARFASSCPALDYYSGFYIAPTGDGRICASRDIVRDRAGGECEIDRIKALVAGR